MPADLAPAARWQLPLAAGLPALIAGVAPGLLPEGLAWAGYAVAVLGAAAAAGAVVALLKPIGTQIRDLGAERDSERLARGGAQAEAARAYAALARDPQAAPDLAASGPEAAAWGELVRAVRQSRQQVANLSRLIHELPLPLLVTDSRGIIRMINPATEKLFNTPRGELLNQPLARFAPPRDPKKQAKSVHDLLNVGPSGTARGVGRTRQGRAIPVQWHVSEADPRAGTGTVLVLARDLSADDAAADRRRRADRAAVARSLGRRAVREVLPANREIGNLLRMLVQEAKQSGQRDRVIQRMRTVQDQAERQGLFAELLDWVCRTEGDGPEPAPPAPAEFMAVEAVRAAQQRLEFRFKERNNVLRLNDEGGWILCDPDVLQTALCGLLLHATESVQGASVTLTLKRERPAAGETGDQIALTLADVGPALSAADKARLADPHAGEAGLDWDAFDNGGAPLGLLAAARLAPLLGGDLTFDEDALGQLLVRLRLPTRLSRAGSAEANGTAHAEAAEVEVAPDEETCAGWRMGFAT